ncbi:hypothetical protein SAMN02990966_00606 [Rhodospirillales bacterium URHD0017]|nr:hypothetical protein SAMN02990966_00606 [Rhodospirillales bacterium URHD0017]
MFQVSEQSFSRRMRFRTMGTRVSGGTPTVCVNAQWAASAQQPADLIYAITAALWNPSTGAS